MENLFRAHPLGYGAMRGLRNLAAALVLGVAPLAAAADEVTIAALGDSLTQGFGLPQEEGFVPQLESWLSLRGHDVEIVNAGVSGDTTAGGRSRIDWTLTPEVDGLIVALGGNDLLRGIDPAVTRENLDFILSRADAAGVETLLVGMRAPGNYGPDYKEEFDAIFPELADSHGALYAESFLAGLEALDDRDAAVEAYMQSDGLHPNAEGVALIVETLGPHVEALVGRLGD